MTLEQPNECTWMLTNDDNRLMVGIGQTHEPVVVIWREGKPDEWELACLIPAAFAHIITEAAAEALK